MLDKLENLYGKEKAPVIFNTLSEMIEKYRNIHNEKQSEPKEWFDNNDVILITYGDQIKEKGKSPLNTLKNFLDKYVKDVISGVHILPFYPYSSDDGFSVIDYLQVNPDLGCWDDIKSLSSGYDLMFDFVVNHISQKSEWFNGFLDEKEPYNNNFIVKEKDYDYSLVTRPRPWPLLSEFQTKSGKKKYVWTTFSRDQVDLNYGNEELFLTMMDVLLDYTVKGAKLVRMDAIGYLWKKDKTSCINLQETHQVVQIMREVLDKATSGTKIVTETNVPHKDNISYFGDGYNEAHMVYNFSLSPLVLHSFQTGNASKLLNWMASIEQELMTEQTCFFNFLASHDGIGVVPARGILTDEEVNNLAEKVKHNKGNVSFKDNGDGTKSPYELNINYMEALSSPDDDLEKKKNRFMAAQSILLAFKGVPGIYIHSLLGSSNYYEKIDPSDQLTFRSINREKFNRKELEARLKDEKSLQYKILKEFIRLIKLRKSEKAFSPNSVQNVLNINDKVLSFLRKSSDGESRVIVLVNVSDSNVNISLKEYLNTEEKVNSIIDIVSGQQIEDISNEITLNPYQFAWFKY